MEVVRGDSRVVRLKQSLKIVGTSEVTLGKFQFERTVVAKTRCDMAPLGEQRLIGRTPADIAADRHRTERAAVVALATRDNAEAFRIATLEPVLARELDRCFGRLGATRSEVDATAIAEIRWGEPKQSFGELFCGRRMKLRRMGEGDLRSLFGHGAPNFGDTVADADNCSLAGCIQQSSAIGGENPRAFTANGDR